MPPPRASVLSTVLYFEEAVHYSRAGVADLHPTTVVRPASGDSESLQNSIASGGSTLIPPAELPAASSRRATYACCAGYQNDALD